MEVDEAVYKGFLLLPPSGKKSKKSPQRKYCLLYKSSKFGIERLEIFDNTDIRHESQHKIIPLDNCIKITNKNDTSFGITTKTDVHYFETNTLIEKNNWIGAIQSVVFPDDASKITTIEEDNDLYCSSEEGIFNVKILSTPASVRCGLDNKSYILLLTQSELQLRNSVDNELLYTWPYCYIRRYGIKSGKFTFEAGRKCKSGEGVFLIDHPNKEEIFRCVGLKMKSMKKRLSNDNTSLLDSDNSLHAALSMEARSRSPLALSSTSNFSIEKLNPVSDTLKSSKTPSKPPRKNVPPTNSFSSSISDYEPIDGYDHIECRSDAWKTYGLNIIDHTEVPCDSEDDDYMSWGGVKNAINSIQSKISNNTAPKIIPQKPNVDDSYDRLNFFGSSNKLNVKSSYKQVSPAPVLPVVEPPSFNDYDEIETCLQGVRPADDSHLGYALVRKEPPKTAPPPAPKDIPHQFHNEDAYAVISKPKQV